MFRFFLLVCLVWSGQGSLAAEAAVDRALAVGLLAHDRGPLSDNNESGADLNLEVRFAPLDVFWSPRPHVGVMLSLQGETSAAYGGLTYRLLDAKGFFFDVFIGLAVHDGPLHKDEERCARSDCGYGSRVLVRPGFELGRRIGRHSAVSLFCDHMSHKWVIPGENEGLDRTGLRYLWSF